MRAEDDLTYQEYKEGVEDAMRYIKNHGWTARQVTDRMTAWMGTETGHRLDDRRR